MEEWQNSENRQSKGLSKYLIKCEIIIIIIIIIKTA